MPAAAAWAARRLGLRGYVLLLTGTGWITYGVGIITDPRYGVSRGVVVLTHWCPLTWWGAMWIACGLVSITGAWQRTGRDVVAFAAAAFPPLIWSGAYLVAWLTGRYPTAWTSIPAWWVPIAVLTSFAALSRRVDALLRKITLLNQELAEARRIQGGVHE